MCFVVTCWERADLLALVCGVFCEFVTFPLVSWVRCGTWLYRFLIFAPLLTFIMPRNCRTPLFYLLPKIHKKNNPGRPIVSACDSPTEKISMYLDTFLHPLAQKTDSYIKDTTHFLQNLNKLGKINKDALLVTIDVTSLYTNIPHRDGIRASKEALDRRTTQEPKTWVLLRLLHFILTKTAFKFDNKFYEQISGTTMGTKCAPSYAIIFMGKLENDFLSTVRQQPLIWWRYIDDIFMIWPHSYQELCSFLTALNSFHETIKFTSEISDTAVNFLDVTVKKDNTGKIHTLLYTKPTDAHLYLHYSSFHPKHQKKSLPYSQALRQQNGILRESSIRHAQTLYEQRIPHTPSKKCHTESPEHRQKQPPTAENRSNQQ